MGWESCIKEDRRELDTDVDFNMYVQKWAAVVLMMKDKSQSSISKL